MHGGCRGGGGGVDWGFRVEHGGGRGCGCAGGFIGPLFLLTWRWDCAVFAHVGLVGCGGGGGWLPKGCGCPRGRCTVGRKALGTMTGVFEH
jgi:hypothetical protein